MSKEAVNEAKKELALRELARRHLDYFVSYVDPFYSNPLKAYIKKEFHKKITDALQKVLKGEIKKLMISVPPQHGKSTISSQRFPLFAHLEDPTLNVALTSYSQELSKSHLAKARQIVDGNRLKNLGEINLKTNTSTSYELKEGGTFNAVGVGGSLTGKPVDLLIIDDVHKDRKEYESTTIRNAVWDWYISVALSRLHSESKQVIVMTRWGEDDLCGRIIELEGEEWTIINIPVLDGDTTIFPERFPLDFIMSKRNVMGERDFQSLYMGDPINEGGGDFKKEYFGNYEVAPLDLDIVTFIDPAISQKQEADNSAIVTIGLDKRSNNIYLLDVEAGKWLPDMLIDKVFSNFIKWRPKRIGLEIVQFQKMLALEIRKQMNIRNIFFVLDEVTPKGEKEARIRSTLQPRYANLSIFHKAVKDIQTAELENELLKFPNGKRDDRIDALAWAVDMLGTYNIATPVNNKIVSPEYI